MALLRIGNPNALFDDRQGRTGGGFQLLEVAERVALHHHERWDGSGYQGLKGEEIPLVGRIVAVADVFDSLSHERPYKRAMSREETLEILYG